MMRTKAWGGHGAGTRAAGAHALVAIGELADVLRQIGADLAESADVRDTPDAPTDVELLLDGLGRVSQLIYRMKPLDADGRERAARHYFAGVFAGACGDDSAIACGVAGSLAQQAGAVSPAAARCFATLARVGRRHGRMFAEWRGQRVPA
ncbi:hypothetical protein KDW55_13455 [Burkholderia sp. AU19243]|uniref:hypothetical protein n=1 Tax=Burkholderia sp. AU19243 TaxID=2824810 RepID=UPI001B99BAEB|nr:hypothetical protein [Burkholderia sp. AU19243]MBR8142407.1 hypothetical protein [Burkholderia vietnamiensis]MBR8364330.1 hypothetical protein [Burkholderia sp. AU19243]